MSDDRAGAPLSRRDAVKAGAAVGTGTALAGCSLPGNGSGDEPVLAEGFEDGLDDWETAAHIGPEEDVSDFEWEISRSQEHAAAGDWSMAVFTEGDHDVRSSAGPLRTGDSVRVRRLVAVSAVRSDGQGFMGPPPRTG